MARRDDLQWAWKPKNGDVPKPRAKRKPKRKYAWLPIIRDEIVPDGAREHMRAIRDE